jgi:hypothetical protein
MEKKMGFDLYGVKPKIKEGSVKPDRPDWNTATEIERDEYFSAMEKFETENKGYYFRNNVWWWRPLAEFVINYTLCVDKKDIPNWHHNDGHLVDEKTAKQIAKQLFHLLNTGKVKEYQEKHTEQRELAKKHNEKLSKKFDALEKKVKKLTGKKDIAPSNYPEPYHSEWEKLYDEKDFRESYPFSESNVKEFAEFAEQSGGFTIC